MTFPRLEHHCRRELLAPALLSGRMFSLVILAMVLPAQAAEPVIQPPEQARIELHVESVLGVEVRDPYRWMENTEGNEFKAWMEGQQRYTEAVLGQATPHERLRDAIATLLQGAPTLGRVSPTTGMLVVERWREDGQSLHAIDDGAAVERSLVTPAMLHAAGRSTRIRSFTPSWDGRYLALTTTGRGDDAPQVSVLDVHSGHLLPDHVTDLLTTTSASRYQVAWLPDSSGFIYPRLASDAQTRPSGERYARGRQFLHRIGTPVASDTAIFGHDVDPSIPTETDDLPSAVLTAPDSPWIVARLARTKRDTSELWAASLDAVLAGRAEWRRISNDGHGTPQLRGNRLHAITRDGADRGAIVAYDLARDRPGWVTVVAEREGVIRDFQLTGDGALYFTELREALDRLYRIDTDGSAAIAIDVPIVGSMRLAAPGNRQDGLWLEASNWIDPGGWFHVAPDRRSALRVPLAPGGSMPPAHDLVIEQLMMPADDGARIPVSVVRPRGRALDGTLPLLLEAYGSFGKIQPPEFNPYIALWVREGAAYAYAHVRGGGEQGDAWHRAALRETKSRTTRDVVAVAQGLVERGYTKPARTVFVGTSNGAQPAGMALATHPESFGVVVYNVGAPDDLRGSLIDPTSARNLVELGDTDTTEGVATLLRNSPYYQVPPRIALPAVVVKSAPDDYNFGSAALTAKYVARLQAANSGDRPVVWLHQSGGHSWLFDGDPEQDARLMAWLLKRVGAKR